MSATTTYAEWSLLFERFADGDDTALENMNLGRFEVDAGTASRFYIKAESAYRRRKQLWLDKFQRASALEQLKSDEDFEIVLRNSRQNLLPLLGFVNIKGFPENLAQTLKKDLNDFVADLRKSMQERAAKSLTGKEKMLLMLNTFNLGELPAGIPKINLVETPLKKEPVAGRKIIF